MLRHCHSADVIVDNVKVSICMKRYDGNPVEDADGLIYRRHVNHRTTASSIWSSDMRASLNYRNVWRSRGYKPGFCAECLRTSPCSLVFSWSASRGHYERALCSRMMLSVSVPNVHSLVSVHRLETFHSSLWMYFVVTWFEISIPFWSCPNRFNTSLAIFKLCSSVVHTLRSCSQMHCFASVPESLFTRYNTGLHHLHCYSSAKYGFHLYTPHMFTFISYVISMFIFYE
jgi:hypothetical protein